MSIKNIYFGPVSSEQLENFGSEGYFEFSGRQWEYRLEIDFENGMLRLYDSVGRMVPIDKEVYGQMIHSLVIVLDAQQGFDSITAGAAAVEETKTEFFDSIGDFAHDDANYLSLIHI